MLQQDKKQDEVRDMHTRIHNGELYPSPIPQQEKKFCFCLDMKIEENKKIGQNRRKANDVYVNI
jgi:hypothetical protein